jgi:hypothetical protein
MIMYKSTMSSPSVAKLDQAAPRQENAAMSQKLMITLKTATAICADDVCHW